MSGHDIILERDTANDEFASIVKVHVSSGSLVTTGQLLFEIENSKANQEIEAPVDGALVHALNEGDDVGLGLAIARIVPPDEAAGAVPPNARLGQAAATPPPAIRSAPVVSPDVSHLPASRGEHPNRPAGRSPVFSKAAEQLLAEHALDPELFTSEFVTSADVLARLGRPVPAPVAAVPTGKGAVSSPRKRAEIRSLGEGAGATLLSVLGVNIGPIAADEAEGQPTITELVIYEASRLVRKYPNLNAAYEGGAVTRHERVSAGLAIDTGGRLVVYGIEDSDRLELADLRAQMDDAVARYLDNSLTLQEMDRATFTVTDLSAEPLDFIFPLLPVGQSCIIGVTRNEAGDFHLYAGFDHRVSEGREVARFLSELRTRLRSFGSNLANASRSCFFCNRSAAGEVREFGGKGLIRMVNADGADVLCCTACFDGW